MTGTEQVCGVMTKAGRPCRTPVDVLPCQWHAKLMYEATLTGLITDRLPLRDLERIVGVLQTRLTRATATPAPGSNVTAITDRTKVGRTGTEPPPF